MNLVPRLSAPAASSGQSPGAALEAHFEGFGVRPRWMQLSAGLGAFMPAPLLPVAEVA